MREILLSAKAGAPAARLALDVYLHRLRAEIAAMAGFDALVFTGGVGENSPAVRAQATDGLGFLGVQIDPDHNKAGTGDREIGSTAASVRTFVINAREEVQIAAEVRHVLG
jgi:acetate kinase